MKKKKKVLGTPATAKDWKKAEAEARKRWGGPATSVLIYTYSSNELYVPRTIRVAMKIPLTGKAVIHKPEKYVEFHYTEIKKKKS